MSKKLVIEHPALFLGELRDDLARVYAIDGNKRYKIIIKNDENDNGCSEALVPFPLENEYEIIDEEI